MRRPALICLAALACAGPLVLGWLRPPGRSLAGDEGTYTAMAESLALDRDLAFDERDRDRVTASGPPGRDTVILQRTAAGISYSKPLLYPLLAAALFPLFGGSSLVVVNGLALLAALWLAYGYLGRRTASGHAALVVVTFAGAGSLLCLLAWRMSDALQVALALAALTLGLAGLGRPAAEGQGSHSPPGSDRAWMPWVAGALFGALVSLRYPNAVLWAGAAASLASSRRWRPLAGLLLGGLLAFAGVGAAQYALTGAVNPYKAVRASFHPATGYPVGAERAATDYEFDVMTKTARIFVRPPWSPRTTGYAALYFLAGRHTGLLAYLPVALLLAWAALRRPDRISWCLLGSVGALVAFYLIWLPTNYFGGAAFVGNRYFVVAYPALLLAPAVLPGRRSLALGWGLAALALASALVSIAGPGRSDGGTQSHTYSGLFRWLPYESVARDIEGRRDRYWSDEFVRFVDPFARVAELGGSLTAGDRAAEVLVATPRPHRVLRFLVRSEAEAVDFSLRDWTGEQTVRLEESAEEPGAGARGLVEIEAGAAWRRHPFWWTGDRVWQSHVVRLRARTPGDGSERVDFAYLGPYRADTKFYRGALMEGELPGEARAGERSTVAVIVRNAGQRFWSSDEGVPVHLAYRLEPGGSESQAPLVQRLVPIEGPVERGHQIVAEIPIDWPQRPGTVRVRIDLLLAGALWFEEIAGAPLLEGEVRVLPVTPPEGG